MKFRYIIAIFVAIALLSLPVVSAQGETLGKLWTSTGDFDTGTYTTSLGNREVNSNTCNPGIPTGQMELDSMKGDSFCIADADAETFKWDAQHVTVSGSCSGGTRVIAAGKLLLNMSADSGTCLDGVVSKAELFGDFQVIVKFTETGTEGAHRILLSDEQTISHSGAGVDGIIYHKSILDNALQAYTVTAGVPSQCGTNTVGPLVVTWFRITRIGTTWTWYYGDDGIAWTQDEQCTKSITEGIWVSLLFTVTVPTTTSGIEADEYRHDASFVGTCENTPCNVAFRSDGEWTSSVYTVPVNKTITSVQLNHTGLNATYAIDRIEFLNNSILRDAYDTDIITGATTIITLNASRFNESDTFQIKIFLKGDGYGTPMITAVHVNVEDEPVPPIPPYYTTISFMFGAMLVFGFIAFMTLMLMAAWWFKGRGGL